MPNIAVIDLETSGLQPWHQINQIACVVYHYSEIVDVFERKLTFDVGNASPDALKIMHYDAELWAKESVDPFVAIFDLISFLRKHGDQQHLSNKGWWSSYMPVMGHNIWTFDMQRLYALAEQVELFLPVWPHPLDTYQLASWQFFIHRDKLRRSIPMNFKLETLAAWFGIRYDRPHDALEDCLVNIEVARKLITYFREL